MHAKATQRLRAGELARLAGVSLPTIKHYVNEGLLPKPLKTGRTMAYYDRSCVDRIKQIKKLQKEKFLPLDVIKRVLDSGSTYEEELELGEAILKSHKLQAEAAPVSQARIARHTGYPLRKIRLLEQEGLVHPATGDGGTYYDSIDCRIIDIMKQREELGLPFDHSVETVKLYRDAIETAVQGDIRLFAKNLLGGFSTEVTLKFLTEVDDSLDSFVVLIRQKMLREISRTAIAQMNELPQKLGMLSFAPIEGAELPDAPPGNPNHRIIYSLCAGAYDDVHATVAAANPRKRRSDYTAAVILAYLLAGDPDSAVRTAEERIPRPTAHPLENTAAALAFLFSVSATSGFSGPIRLVKKALDHLRHVETARGTTGLPSLFSRYVCGAVYTMLPDIFDTQAKGTEMLKTIEQTLRKQKAVSGRLPVWIRTTVTHEILPALEVRVNRFLAEGYLSQADYANAYESVLRLIELVDADDEHSKWARLKKLEIKAAAER
jgi:DNA-binding transcriptional MerR regulator